MLTVEQKARIKELKEKGSLTEEEQTELNSLNKLESGKTYSQDEVNGLITKKSREAQEKMLKDLGIDSMESAKDGLAKLKDLQDKDKTELEKAQSTIADLTKQIEGLTSDISGKDIQVALLGAGVNGEQLPRYTKLYGTYEGENVEDNIKSLLEEFPLETKQVQTPAFSSKSGGASTEPTMEELAQQVSDAMN